MKKKFLDSAESKYKDECRRSANRQKKTKKPLDDGKNKKFVYADY